MLQSLKVKNLALMEETEVTFGEGLNILTGETGAGKSLLIGSVNLALGAKFEKDMLREGAQQAYVELVFSGNDKIRQKLLEMELENQEDGSVMLARKMQVGKSVFRINGEAVTVKQVKELAEVLIDIHGQHEHQSLLHKKKHLEILDAFGGEEAQKCLGETSSLYHAWKELEKKISQEALDEKERAREQSLAEYELAEIEKAALKVGEEEELDSQFRLMSNSQRITEALGESYQFTGDSSQGAGGSISRAVRLLGSVSEYDPRLAELEGQLLEVESLLSDYNRDLSDYMADLSFDGEVYEQVQARLNLINRLKEKYGNGIEEILAYAQERKEYLKRLADYDEYMADLHRQCDQAKEKLLSACATLGKLRQKNAKALKKLLTEALENLNFLQIDFEVELRPLEEPTDNGLEEVEFLISTNPGQPPRSLGSVASGGELSRIMLAIKTVLAKRDAIDALIFDEIDTGISGRTAWQVSKQLGVLSGAHQVICITHLPQIASMADAHFLIEKSTDAQKTVTDVRRLSEEESLGELARLLGSDGLTEAALTNARDMRRQAMDDKKAKKN